MDFEAPASGSRRALLGLAALAVVGLLAGYAVAVRGRPEPVTLELGAELDTPTGGNGSPAPETIVVHVAGAVARPGVYELTDGARVDDALAAAGGPASDADLDGLNLAAKLFDGDKVVVLRQGEAPAGESGGDASGRVNLNSASASELEALPGVGPATAQKIIAYREEHGRFGSVDELMNVPGIGPAKFEALADLVTV